MTADAAGFDPRAVALIGAGSQGRLAGPAGRVLEIVEPLLDPPPGDPIRHAALRCVLGLALHTRWLHERTSADASVAIDHVRAAVGLVPHRHPLRDRLRELLAGMLLDRGRLHGDRADPAAALGILRSLLVTAVRDRIVPDLNELLLDVLNAAGERTFGAVLSRPPDGVGVSGAAFRAGLVGAHGSALLTRAVLDADGGALGQALDALRTAAGSVPAADGRRPDVLSDLGLARLLEARSRNAADEVGAALDALLAAAADCPPGHPRRATIVLRAAGAVVAADPQGSDPQGPGPQGPDRDRLDRAVESLREALGTAGSGFLGERARCRYGLSQALLVRYRYSADPRDLREAVEQLEEARIALDPAPGDPFAVPLLRALSTAYRAAGAAGSARARRQSRTTGRSLLHTHARAVLLQSDPGRGLAVTRPVADDARRLVDWCLADGDRAAAVEALELGRGLVLHAATVAADVPGLLRGAGRLDLAEEWNAAVPRDPGSDGGPGGFSSFGGFGGFGDSGSFDSLAGVAPDLRHRVFAVLGRGPAETRLLSAPGVEQIAAALRSLDVDALAYLVAGTGRERDGRALIVDRTGSVRDVPLPRLCIEPGGAVERYGEAHQALLADLALDGAADADQARRNAMLSELCDWAWTAATGPILDHVRSLRDGLPRLVVAPTGMLAVVPWHAARREIRGDGSHGPSHRHACQDAVFSTCASARQLVEAAYRTYRPRPRPRPSPRPRLRTGGRTVFVANPERNSTWSSFEAHDICSAYYPDAVLYGKAGTEPTNGPGTPAEVLACLPGAGLVHLGCHALAEGAPERSHLQLAGGRLTVAEILAQGRDGAPDAPGALVVLAACTSDVSLAEYDEALTVASAFLAAGAAGVVGARWEAPEAPTALLMFMLHRSLSQDPDISPADALRSAQLWMADPAREVPAEMPERMAAEIGWHRIGDLAAWAAFSHHGR